MAAQRSAARRAKTRRFETPEGVDLELRIASASLRLGALLLDLFFMVVILLAATFFLWFAGTGSGRLDAAAIVWLLGFFLLRNFWFILFELGPRAATPGKRIVGIRVVARDGGRLTVASVVARNLVREMEIFLPIAFLAGGAGDETVNGWMVAFGLLWTAGMGFFLLFNRDRMRLGDLIGGTWVVIARRAAMAADLATRSPAAGALLFSPADLGVYGVFELQELERVLRAGDARAIAAVADTIAGKIGRDAPWDGRAFLDAYYAQARARMERDLLFGKRRADKYEVSA